LKIVFDHYASDGLLDVQGFNAFLRDSRILPLLQMAALLCCKAIDESDNEEQDAPERFWSLHGMEVGKDGGFGLSIVWSLHGMERPKPPSFPTYNKKIVSFNLFPSIWSFYCFLQFFVVSL
jgi:hypothetical protein